ncbi:MAG: ABC transporter ATP-binding protein [Candidimonas sp.]|nr:MAG: ABC transporter ATP-binding protein [Candidimonas sp.]
MADAADTILAMHSLTVGYGEAPIVREFSASFERASINCLIGGNGAGKSTLLRAIFGLNRVFSGGIDFDGQRIEQLTPEARLRLGVSFVPQGRCNFTMMTVKENLEMGAFSLPKREVSAAVDRVVALFPVLERKLHEWAGNLSGGEQQILETAMALEVEPRLLLLDEPSLGLSPKMQDQVFGTVEAIRKTGVTIILVEQNVHQALRISDRAIVMSMGTKFRDGAACEIVDDPVVKKAYLGA